jgi:hypothetical protein
MRHGGFARWPKYEWIVLQQCPPSIANTAMICDSFWYW